MRKVLLFSASLAVLGTVGCGSGHDAGTTGGSLPAPTIVVQPANQNVPMGLTGTFSVQALGQGDRFQWSRNGNPIVGATGSTYVTVPTVFSDSGSIFSVVITNNAGSISSQPATLTVTARAPIPGDLRFQQVDSESSRNGYTINPGFTALFCPGAGQGGLGESFGSSFGTAYALVNSPCVYPSTAFSQLAGLPALEMAYYVGPPQDYPNLLNQSIAPGGPTSNDPGSVIASFALSSSAVAIAFIHSDTVSGFYRVQYVVPASSLQALASQEGLRGRVLTAISYDGSQATVFSYGWSGDPVGIYETKVVFTTLKMATDAITQLASQGYILTASGSTQAPDGSGVILVGTRMLGDIMPRPTFVSDVLSGSIDPLLEQGFAPVARIMIYDPQTSMLITHNLVGER